MPTRDAYYCKKCKHWHKKGSKIYKEHSKYEWGKQG